MSPTKRERRRQRHARQLAAAIDQFLTPALVRQAYKAFRSSRRTLKPPSQRPHHRHPPRRRATQRPNRRWDLKPLILVLVSLTWCRGETEERFQNARDFANAARPKRRRTGASFAGFQKALARLRMAVLAILARGIRDQFLRQLGPTLLEHGFLPLGCDGTRLECPRTDELLRHLDPAGNADSAPTLWVTALVHLTTGVPWHWRVDTGTASERHHLIEMIGELPATALVICDAGYDGFELASALSRAERCFLIRLSSKVRLLTEDQVELASYHEGRVYYWPKEVQEKGRPPLPVRMIRVAGQVPAKDVWLLTNVLDPERLSVAQAGRFYRMRWENEGMFRTYKRTLNKVKLVSRTVRAVRREAYGSLLATQLLLGSGALALHQKRCRAAASRARSERRPVVSTPCSATPCSARKVLTAFRSCLASCRREDRTTLQQRLEQSERERRQRQSPKQKREWPRRKPHQAPKPPKVLTMTEEQKSLLAKHKSDSEAA
jgi:Transposase DDE domain